MAGEAPNYHPGTKSEESGEVSSEQELVAEILAEIEHATSDENYRTFEEEGEKAYKYYKNQGKEFKLEGSNRVAFNVFWANTETLMPIYYARLPKTVATRRVDSNEKISVLACKMLENATKYSLDQEADDFNEVINMCVKDTLVVGRGQARAFYSAEFEEVIGEDGKPYKRVIPYTEKATTGYIYWKDYLSNRARNATEHRWRGHRSYLTRRELIRKNAKIGPFIPLTDGEDSKNDENDSTKKDYVGKAAVWEIWLKTLKKRVCVCPAFSETPLEIIDDPLGLDGFYPYPRPLTGTTSTDSDIPTGQFKIDKALLDELNEVMKRIMSIRKVIRVVGLHDRQISDSLIKLKNKDDGTTEPANFPADKNGLLKSGLDWFPFEKASKALQDLIQYSEFLINRLYQQDGIPDIVRGSSNPNETLGAQQIKSNFTVIRTNKKQADVQRFVRDLLSLKAQIIFEPGLFSDEMIYMMCGADSYSEEEKQLYPAAMALLRDDKLRTFKIDIETDSTIAVDEESDKQTAIEAYTAMNNAINTSFQVMQMDPELGLTMAEMGLYVAGRFRGSRDWQSSIQRWIDKKENELAEQQRIDEAIKNGEMEPPPPPVDPEQLKAEADQNIAEMKLQIEQQKAMHKAQLDEAIAQHKAAMEQMKTMSDIQMKQAKLEADSILKEKEVALKANIARMELMQESMAASEKNKLDTIASLRASAEKEPKVPNFTFVLPGGTKKISRTSRDPATGDYISTSEDLQ